MFKSEYSNHRRKLVKLWGTVMNMNEIIEKHSGAKNLY